MAETPVLGAISVAGQQAEITDPNSVGHRETLANIASVGESIADSAKSNALEGLRQENSQDTDTILAASGPKTPQDELGVVVPSSQDQFLLDKISKLKAGIAQNNGSAKALLELELRKNASKLGDRFPGLRDEIAQTNANFVRTDPEYAALDLADASSKTFQAQQAKDLQRIKDTAYDKLGMIPGRTDFGSPEFVREYNYLANLRQATNDNSTVNDAMDAEETRTARGFLDGIQNAVMGATSDTSELVFELGNIVRDVSAAARDVTAPGASATLNAYENGGRDAALGLVQNSIFTLESKMNDFPLTMAHTTSYANARALIDQQVGALTKLSTALVDQDFNLVDAWETFNVSRSIQFQVDNPVLGNLGAQMEEHAVLYEAISKDFGAQGDILMNSISGLVRQSMPHLFGVTYGMSGISHLRPGASEQEILNTQRAIRTQNPYPYGNGQNTPEGVQTNATVHQQQMLSPAVLTRAATNGGKGISPDVATNILGATASWTEHMLISGALAPDAARPHLQVLANPDFKHVADLARAGKVPKVTVAAGNMYRSMLFDKEVEAARLGEYAALRNTVINGVSASQLIVIDPAELAKGKVVFRADPARIDKLVPESKQGTTFGAIGLGGDLRPKANGLQQAQQVAADLTSRVNDDLMIQANINYLLVETPEVDFENAWVSSGLQETFGVVPEVRREPNIKLEPVDPVLTTGNSAASRTRRGQ